MTVEEFWTIVERSGVITPDKDDRAEWLTDRLATMALDAVIGFGTCSPRNAGASTRGWCGTPPAT